MAVHHNTDILRSSRTVNHNSDRRIWVRLLLGFRDISIREPSNVGIYFAAELYRIESDYNQRNYYHAILDDRLKYKSLYATIQRRRACNL